MLVSVMLDNKSTCEKKAKIINWDYFFFFFLIKAKRSKPLTKESQFAEWEKILVSNIFVKVLKSKLYKKL